MTKITIPDDSKTPARISRHTAALIAIRDFDFGSVKLTESEREIIEIAAEALEPKKHETGVDAKVLEIKALLLTSPPLMFASSEVVADAANAAGMTSIRGKAWTKSSMTSFLTKARDLIAKDMIKMGLAKSVFSSVVEHVEGVLDEKAGKAIRGVPEAVVVQDVPVSMGDDLGDDLDDLAILAQLDA